MNKIVQRIIAETSAKEWKRRGETPGHRKMVDDADENTEIKDYPIPSGVTEDHQVDFTADKARSLKAAYDAAVAKGDDTFVWSDGEREITFLAAYAEWVLGVLRDKGILTEDAISDLEQDKAELEGRLRDIKKSLKDVKPSKGRGGLKESDDDDADDDEEKTYKIVRTYFDGHKPKVMETGLSLADAREWCRDPETSSRTATSKEAVAHTAKYGPWFDGYDLEESVVLPTHYTTIRESVAIVTERPAKFVETTKKTLDEKLVSLIRRRTPDVGRRFFTKDVVVESDRWSGPLPDIDWIMAFEDGSLDRDDAIEGLQHLIDTRGWRHLQGFYGRTCRNAIMNGDCTDTHGDFTGKAGFSGEGE